MTRRKCLVAALLLWLGMAAPCLAAYPSQPITLIVPFPPGGTSDAVAHALRTRLAENLKQQVTIDYVAGGAGAVGAMRLKHAAPDGHTIMVASLTTYVAGPLSNTAVNYDSARDFDLLTVAVHVPNVLVVHPDVPAQTVAEFVDYLKRHPDQVRFSTSGAGGQDQLSMQLFWQRTGTRGVFVHRKGSAPAVADVAAGRVQASIQNLSVALPYIENAQLRALAVTGSDRSSAIVSTPTLTELGVPGIETYSWQGIAAPKGLPPAVKTRLHKALVASLDAPEVRRHLTRAGFEVVANTPAEFERFLHAQRHHWQAIIDRARRTSP
ncbi:MAG TPA: tripartite tricarboxylate transporter substrate binding protein [Burkholderiales bacterium]|nr:tripartite tricarboxylate transporter substrate binding protein [Burkholderiales bacterium]